MKWTGLNELREKYLSFFESKGHLRVKSFPLIPQNDNSLLLINSGMAPMKKYFTGEITPPKTRITSCQKCIRTPDIERVGKTARHGTYFEMLGNFSFGDYFKVEATAWAWEFCTVVLELPVDKLWVTIYLDDDEAFDIWTEKVGVPADRIVRMGKEDNFWEHGAGPCGPCSEIYFDRGVKHGCDHGQCEVGCECDRFVEFWNLVFTQFNSDGNGNYTPLAKPNIDTGMGLERLACIMQGVNNLFEVDTITNIMKEISLKANVKYGMGEKTDISLRVVTDHIRSTTFMIGDGVMPSNEGRGYVLRRLLRRAARHGRLLGIKEPFLSTICDTVIECNRDAYPELFEKREFIKKLIFVEEESFGRTIDQGLQQLEELCENLDGKILCGDDAFKLYDTFGFPIDLTRDILEEKGLSVDEAAFTSLMKEQRERARAARKNAGADAWAGKGNLLENIKATEFYGYGCVATDSKVLAIIKEGELANSIFTGESGIIVLDKTVFYAESGGQVGDSGKIFGFQVENTTKTHDGIIMHSGTMTDGIISTGENVIAEFDGTRREAIMRNHTAAHLLQAALRKVLGNHVEQAGQLVDAERMRFDFTHFSAMTSEEMNAVETQVNDNILRGLTVENSEMAIDDARKLGAMALFGEKYGDTVRVVNAVGASIELCGGTHVNNTAKIGLFRIVSESSVASGVRRIEAVTGFNLMNLINAQKRVLDEAALIFKLSNSSELIAKAKQTALDLKEKDKEIEALKMKIIAEKLDGLIETATDLDGLKIITASFADSGADVARSIGESLRDRMDNVVAVIAGVEADKNAVSFSACCGKVATAKGAHAGNLIREVAKIAGGSGGGRPEAAMAGGKDLSKVEEALGAVTELLKAQLK